MPFPAPEDALLAAERALGAALPAAYRSALAKSNGGELAVLGDLWQLHPIEDTSDRRRLSRATNHVLRETKVLKDWPGFPGNALTIAANGVGDHLVLLQSTLGVEDAIYLWQHETGAVVPVATSFAELCSPSS